MKAYRGTLIAGAGLLVLGVGVSLFAPEILPFGDSSEEIGVPTIAETKLVSFEQHELVAFRVEQPGGEVISVVQSEDGDWTIEGTGFAASYSMVHRIQHQFFELKPRC